MSSHTCVEGDVDVSVDGMLDDWSGVTKVRAGGTARDGSFDLYCVYDDNRIALAFDVARRQGDPGQEGAGHRGHGRR